MNKKNSIQISSEAAMVCAVVTESTKTAFNEIQSQNHEYLDELSNINTRLTKLESKVLCKDELNNLENQISQKLNESFDKKLDKLEDNLKIFIRENVAMKSDVDNMSRKTIEWVEKHSATKLDISESKNSLLWKLIGVVSLIVAATAYIVKS